MPKVSEHYRERLPQYESPLIVAFVVEFYREMRARKRDFWLCHLKVDNLGRVNCAKTVGCESCLWNEWGSKTPRNTDTTNHKKRIKS